MTNNTNTTTLTRDYDGITYSITLPTDDRAILRLALEMQRDAAARLYEIALRDLQGPYSIDTDRPMTQFDYSGDHDDYNPAASRLAHIITSALCAQTFNSALDMMTAIFNDDDFLFALDLIDFDITLDYSISD